MDKIVTVRMPQALFDKLSSLSKEQHYLDISECLRSITRKKCLELTAPYAFELNQLRSEISTAFSQNKQSREDGERKERKEQLLKDLKNILKEM